MECNCISEVAAKVKEHFTTAHKNLEGYKSVESSWERSTFYPVSRLFFNYNNRYTFTKKDGSTSKPRNEHIAVYPTYCPFCGKKFPTKTK